MEPRTPVLLTIKYRFWSGMQSSSGNVSPIIALDMSSKLRLELITYRNDNATQKFYRFQVLKNVRFLRKISFFENFEKD